MVFHGTKILFQMASVLGTGSSTFRKTTDGKKLSIGGENPI
jgi:hypothetical protein